MDIVCVSPGSVLPPFGKSDLIFFGEARLTPSLPRLYLLPWGLVAFQILERYDSWFWPIRMNSWDFAGSLGKENSP